MKKVLSYIVCFLIISSCQIGEVDNQLEPFFDMNDFLEKEVTKLSNLKTIKKKVTINDKTDEQIVKEFDLKKDLEVFRNSNINKVSWLDRYEIDSTLNASGKLSRVKYHTADSKLKTKEFIVNFEGGKVSSISILNSSSNQVTDFNQQLKYFPQEGYSVESLQKVTLTDKQTLKVEVDYMD